ncbi:MAG TPA: DUF2254 family protein [Pseudonocardiaceae bacterium]|nr:DUF2254 family protein [Pseudonocardiaceae bacterium]
MLPLTALRWRHRRRRLYSVPTAFVLVALVLSWAMPAVDRAVDARLGSDDLAGFVFDSSTVAGTLSAIASGMIAFSGLVFTLLLLAVQFGTGQLSARLVPLLARDLVIRSALGVFTATFVYALLIAIRLGTRLQQYHLWLSSLLGIGLLLLSTVLFFAMITRMVDLLRVARVCTRLGRRGIAYVPATHPHEYTPDREPVPGPDGPPTRVIRHRERPGVLVDLDVAAVARLARRRGVRLSLTPAFGEFTRADGVLFEVRGAARVPARRLRALVAFAEEHAISGRHPSAMLRVLVDIALKALSPGINDPTTVTQALDEIEMLLLALAERELGPVTVCGRHGEPLLDYRLPDWADYLSLATDEIRHYGTRSVQVLRRLRALYAELIRHTPVRRHAPVLARIAALDDVVRREHSGPLESALASRPDRLGIGGPRRP